MREKGKEACVQEKGKEQRGGRREEEEREVKERKADHNNLVPAARLLQAAASSQMLANLCCKDLEAREREQGRGRESKGVQGGMEGHQ